MPCAYGAGTSRRLELTTEDRAPNETTTLLVEFDRTRRLDKNYDKFRRYDSFLNAWWQHTHFADHERPPCVLFVCQDPEQREQFLNGADHQLTGHHWHASASPDQQAHLGRRHMLFAIEPDAHRGQLDGWQLPAFPPGHPARDNKVHRIILGGTSQPGPPPAQLRLPSVA